MASNQPSKFGEVKDSEPAELFSEEQGSHASNDSKSDTHVEAKVSLTKSILKQRKSVSFNLQRNTVREYEKHK